MKPLNYKISSQSSELFCSAAYRFVTNCHRNRLYTKHFDMHYLLLFLTVTCGLLSYGQNPKTVSLTKDTLLVIPKDIVKGFHHEYLLFIPKGTPIRKQTVLLVEPNNTGKTSDNIEVHKQSAIRTASVNGVGNNVATNLRIPFLVPVFPRPDSQPLVYSHALDRDVMVADSPELKRLDLQLLAMIADAKNILRSLQIEVDTQFFMTGFSASATFTNSFSFLHPEMIKALAIGGFNGKLMLPEKQLNKVKLYYPIGTYDFEKLLQKPFDAASFKKIPQYIYMGALDDNDAVQFDDAYNDTERDLIKNNLGKQVQDRYLKCQEIYQQHQANAVFKTYEDVGHWTTSVMNLDVTKFFLEQMKSK